MTTNPPPAYYPPPPNGGVAPAPAHMLYPPPPGHYPPVGYPTGPSIITISGTDSGTLCPFCNQKTNHVAMKRIGNVAIAWIVSLSLLGCLLWAWIPCTVDGCKDV